jgi:hypothetical protein
MKRLWFVLAGLMVAAAQAAGPAQVGVNAGQGCEVTPTVGPWMILAASFTGPQARESALKWVEALRTRYRMPAYYFNFVDEERQKEKERVDQLRKEKQAYLAKMNLAPDTPIRIPTRRFEDQYAVLVGGYKNEEAARAELMRVKQLPPSSPPPSPPGKPIDPREITWGPGENPFVQAFIVPNPTIKREPPPENARRDPFLKTLNADETYNLLKCPKRYTLAVAQFRTAATTSIAPSKPAPKSSFLQKLGFGGDDSGGQSVTASAMSAHNLAEMLRNKLNFEAYVFHTRFASVVTIGSFDRPDEPALQALRDRLTRLKLDPIPLLSQFLPMDVDQYR